MPGGVARPQALDTLTVTAAAAPAAGACAACPACASFLWPEVVPTFTTPRNSRTDHDARAAGVTPQRACSRPVESRLRASCLHGSASRAAAGNPLRRARSAMHCPCVAAAPCRRCRPATSRRWRRSPSTSRAQPAAAVPDDQTRPSSPAQSARRRLPPAQHQMRQTAGPGTEREHARQHERPRQRAIGSSIDNLQQANATRHCAGQIQLQRAKALRGLQVDRGRSARGLGADNGGRENWCGEVRGGTAVGVDPDDELRNRRRCGVYSRIGERTAAGVRRAAGGCRRTCGPRPGRQRPGKGRRCTSPCAARRFLPPACTRQAASRAAPSTAAAAQ